MAPSRERGIDELIKTFLFSRQAFSFHVTFSPKTCKLSTRKNESQERKLAVLLLFYFFFCRWKPCEKELILFSSLWDRFLPRVGACVCIFIPHFHRNKTCVCVCVFEIRFSLTWLIVMEKFGCTCKRDIISDGVVLSHRIIKNAQKIIQMFAWGGIWISSIFNV